MGKVWTDRGNGQWKLTITSDDPDDTAPPSVYYGTREEIADKLADSQAHANRRLSEIRRNGGTPPAASPAAPAAPRPLTAQERMTTVAELNNPATVDRAVTRVMESVLGPVETLRENSAADREDREAREAANAARTFAEQTPDWHPSEHNKLTLMHYMEARGWSASDPRRYTQAFEALAAAQLLQPRPQEQNDNSEPSAAQPERNAPAPAPPQRPARYSSGVRSSEMSGMPPASATNPRLKYTREQIAKMSAATYKQKLLTDPEFVKASEYYAEQDRKARGRRTAVAV